MGRKHFRRFITGKKRFQRIFSKLHEFSLLGLNIGGGDNVAQSGERHVIAVAAERCLRDRSAIIFDVGANVGVYAKEILSVFGERAHVYCFEPLKKAYAFLTDNMRGHRHVHTFPIALGETEGSATIHANDSASTLASCLRRDIDHLGITMAHSEEITVKRLDAFCREHKIDRIDLLKIDVEGGELSVLKGATEMLNAGAIHMIQFEFGPCHIDARVFFKDFFRLLSPRYHIYRVLRDGLKLVDKYREADEIFLTTNYLAVTKNHG